MLANPGDIILVAGKGHEKYQEINGVKNHFDDMEELENRFKDLV
jgi:UDP-N-acetylmuramoyl-L-alanyl-D-glutamate--2,6-diaminopimelate ligase